jgi:pilus assembly protein Flp/PilA
MMKGMTKIDTFASDTFAAKAARAISRFCSDESGATAIEYGMIASGVGAFLAATVYGLGGKVKAMFTTLAGMFP